MARRVPVVLLGFWCQICAFAVMIWRMEGPMAAWVVSKITILSSVNSVQILSFWTHQQASAGNARTTLQDLSAAGTKTRPRNAEMMLQRLCKAGTTWWVFRAFRTLKDARKSLTFLAIAHSVTTGIALIRQLTNVKFAHHQAASLRIFPLSITYVHAKNVYKTFTWLRAQWYVRNARIQTAQFAPTMCAQNARFFITCRARVRAQLQWQVACTGRRQRPARHAAKGIIWEVITNVIHVSLIAENAVTDSLVQNATQTFIFIRAVRVV